MPETNVIGAARFAERWRWTHPGGVRAEDARKVMDKRPEPREWR